jgi:TRAP transporter 4TM/12TM fusion protein
MSDQQEGKELRSNHRQYTGFMKLLIQAYCVCFSLYFLLYLTHIFEFIGINIPLLSHRAIALTLFLVLAFLLVPAAKNASRTQLPWYDILIILLVIIAGMYYPFNYDVIVRYELIGEVPGLEAVYLFILIGAITEASRRVIGWPMVILILFLLAQLFFGKYWPGIIHAANLSLSRMTLYLYIAGQGILGIAMAVGSTVIVAFILFGALLRISGAGAFFIDLALAVAGRYRGGPAKAAVIASTLFGTISGSGVANVATTGTITIPLMKSIGYRPTFAGAVEAVASNGGQITPPVMGVVAFLMAEILNTTYWSVCIAAAIPCLLYYLSLLAMVDFEALKNNLQGLSRDQLPSLWRVLRHGWYFLIPMLVLIYLLAVLRYNPTLAVLYAMGPAFILSFVKKDTAMKPRRTVQMLEEAARGMVEPGIGIAGSSVIIAAIGLTGLGFNISILLTSLAHGNIYLLLAIGALTSFILGMGLASVPCYVLLAVMVGPSLLAAGITPIGAHLFFFWWGILSFITPPVAISAYVAAAIAGSDMWETGWQAARLGIISYLLSFAFVLNPELLLIGDAVSVLLAVISACLGAYLLASAVEGILFRPLNSPQRALLLLAAVLLLWPGWITDIIGLILVTPVFLVQLRKKPRYA